MAFTFTLFGVNACVAYSQIVINFFFVTHPRNRDADEVLGTARMKHFEKGAREKKKAMFMHGGLLATEISKKSQTDWTADLHS